MRGILIFASILLSGCVLWGGGPREVPLNPELEHSRKLLAQAAKNPTVASHFKRELDEARVALDQAGQIWHDEKGKLDEDDKEWQEIRHLNYLARQRTAIVVMKARGLDAERELSQLHSGRGTGARATPKPEALPAQSVVSKRLPSALQGLQPRQDSRGLILTLGEHYFDTQNQLINSEAIFDALLEFLVANPGSMVSCEGYLADSNGQGQQLSQQRARAVQDALLQRGLEFSRITAMGYGSTATGQTGLASSMNRVEIVIADTVPVNYSDLP